MAGALSLRLRALRVWGGSGFRVCASSVVAADDRLFSPAVAGIWC